MVGNRFPFSSKDLNPNSRHFTEHQQISNLRARRPGQKHTFFSTCLHSNFIFPAIVLKKFTFALTNSTAKSLSLNSSHSTCVCVTSLACLFLHAFDVLPSKRGDISTHFFPKDFDLSRSSSSAADHATAGGRAEAVLGVLAMPRM